MSEAKPLTPLTSSLRSTRRQVTLPDFIVGGAPRSGTTWLYHLLERHPDVFMAKPVRPEPKFFLVDDLYAQGIEYYSGQWFTGVQKGAVTGEKSTNYLENRTAAQRIREHLPSARLVFILREPAERAYSNYLWSKMNGLEDEDFATALALEQHRERMCPPHLRYSRPYAYFSRGLYADLLSVYFELFDRRQILCLKYDDLVTAPDALARRLHAFIGVAERPGDSRNLDAANRASGPEADAAILASLRDQYQDANRHLTDLLGADFLWST